MADNQRAIREALDIYRRSAGFDEFQKAEAVRLLAEHGIWSLSHISALARVSRFYARQRVEKTDHTGGRFNPETLEWILEEFLLKQQNETNPKLTALIVEMGTSSGFLARILEQPWSSVKWRVNKAKEAAA
ncbi:MAG: hypothetical protein K0Q52_143 [Microbacterium sp.]|jgi:hypothetical protein|nr:hypothetical protein [Microbacterium sp.]